MFEYETKTRTDFPVPKRMILEYDHIPTIPNDRTLYIGGRSYTTGSITVEDVGVSAVVVRIEVILNK